jgi:dephospho-CoA kinase
MIIGLTGPMAAGKDEVAKILRRRGAAVINVDSLAHQLYPPQSSVWQELIKAFGSRILNRGGEINRQKLGEIVFADREQLRILNSIVHPQLKNKVVSEINSCQLLAVSCQLIVINAAVLKEIGLIDLVDKVWVVIAPQAVRLKRLIKAGYTKKEAQQRMKAQLPLAEYLAIADVVIKNDGTLKQLNAKVQASL